MAMEEDLSEIPEHLAPYRSKPGITRCLKCQRKFSSEDKIRLRICPSCTAENRKAGGKDAIADPSRYLEDF